MRRVVAACALLASAALVAGFGGSRLRAIAHQQAKYYGDPHATITRIETVRIFGARRGHERWTMIRLQSSHEFQVGCISPGPGLAGSCHARYLEIGVDLANEGPGLAWGLTGAEASAIDRARKASPLFRIFPDTPGLYLRCNIPRGGPKGGVPLKGTCSTIAAPTAHVRRVEFVEHWGGSKKAGWVVTRSSSGRVSAIRVTGQPPQLWR